MSRPRVSFKTIGCRLNRAETASIAAQFERAGYAVVPFGDACEVCVVHSCAITRNAERDSARAARQAKAGPGRPFVVVAGCASVVSADYLRRSAAPDLVVGQSHKFELPALLSRQGVVPLAPEAADASSSCADTPLFDSARAWIKVQDGCDFACAYCVVPRARGAPRSRPFAEIIDEAARIAGRGYREIVLAGANVGRYSDGPRRIRDLLEALAGIAGIERIRLSSIELTTAERAVVDFMAECPRMCRFLHLPLQSGDDRVLAAMGRRYRAREFRAFVEYAAERVPGIGLGTDVIVGFPGEDAAAFGSTAALLSELPFSNLHVFPFSPRPGTRAADMPDPVPEPVRKERVRELIELGRAKRESFAARFVGEPVSVLIEQADPSDTAIGWTGEYVEVRVRSAGSRLVGQVLTLHPSSLHGDVLHALAPGADQKSH